MQQLREWFTTTVKMDNMHHPEDCRKTWRTHQGENQSQGPGAKQWTSPS